MHNAARLEEDATLLDLNLFLANQSADPPPVYEGVLIFVLMAVRYDEFMWGEHRRLRGEPPFGVFARDQLAEDRSGDVGSAVP